MRLLCRIGIHKWKYYAIKDQYDYEHRVCLCCPESQHRGLAQPRKWLHSFMMSVQRKHEGLEYLETMESWSKFFE